MSGESLLVRREFWRPSGLCCAGVAWQRWMQMGGTFLAAVMDEGGKAQT